MDDEAEHRFASPSASRKWLKAGDAQHYGFGMGIFEESRSDQRLPNSIHRCSK